MVIKMIIDLLFTIGTIGFTIGDIVQFIKIYLTHKTSGISLRHYLIKIFALSCMIIGFTLSNLHLSLSINIIDLLLTFGIVYMLFKYRKIKIKNYCRKLIKIWIN